MHMLVVVLAYFRLHTLCVVVLEGNAGVKSSAWGTKCLLLRCAYCCNGGAVRSVRAFGSIGSLKIIGALGHLLQEQTVKVCNSCKGKYSLRAIL